MRHITEIAMETGGKEMLCQLDSQQSLVELILLPLKSAVISVYNWKEYMLVKQNLSQSWFKQVLYWELCCS